VNWFHCVCCRKPGKPVCAECFEKNTRFIDALREWLNKPRLIRNGRRGKLAR
jgi:hypothetical protein